MTPLLCDRCPHRVPVSAMEQLAKLPPAARRIALMIGTGASNKDIAKRFNISTSTVKAQLTIAYRTLGVSDRLQLGLKLKGAS